MPRKPFRSAPLITNINVSGFLAIELVFLVMFMFYPGLPIDGMRFNAKRTPVDLPHVLHPVSLPKMLREDALVITIERDGSVSFETGRVSPGHVAAKLRERLAQGAERKVYFQVDARAKYGNFRQLLWEVRAAGIEDIAIVCDGPPIPASMQAGLRQGTR